MNAQLGDAHEDPFAKKRSVRDAESTWFLVIINDVE